MKEVKPQRDVQHKGKEMPKDDIRLQREQSSSNSRTGNSLTDSQAVAASDMLPNAEAVLYLAQEAEDNWKQNNIDCIRQDIRQPGNSLSWKIQEWLDIDAYWHAWANELACSDEIAKVGLYQQDWHAAYMAPATARD